MFKFFLLACAAATSFAAGVQTHGIVSHPAFKSSLATLGLDEAGCACSAKECSCCVDVKNTKIIKFDVNFCANLALIDNDNEVSLTITVSGDTLFTQDYNISELSKLSEECVKIFTGVDGCLEVTNFTNNETYIGACLSVDLKIDSKVIGTADIGCYGLTVSNKDACEQGILQVCGAVTGTQCESCYTSNEAALDKDGCDADLVKEICGQ